jgi:hypothetical protein
VSFGMSREKLDTELKNESFITPIILSAQPKPNPSKAPRNDDTAHDFHAPPRQNACIYPQLITITRRNSQPNPKIANERFSEETNPPNIERHQHTTTGAK